jgi:hypothetical protein
MSKSLQEHVESDRRATIEFTTNTRDDDYDKIEHRWRIKAANGEVIAASTQGYSRRIDALNNLAQIAAAILAWSRENDSE